MGKTLIKLIAERVIERLDSFVLKNGKCTTIVERRDVVKAERRGGVWELTAVGEWIFYIPFLSPENDIPRDELARGLEYLELGVNQCYVEDVELPFMRYLEFRSDLILVEDLRGALYMYYDNKYYLSPYWERFRNELRPYPELPPPGSRCGWYFKFDFGRWLRREGRWYVFDNGRGVMRAWDDPVVPSRFCIPPS